MGRQKNSDEEIFNGKFVRAYTDYINSDSEPDISTIIKTYDLKKKAI